MNWKELLSAYLDGELSPEWRRKAERLLAESASARKYLEDLRQVDSDLQRVPDHQLSPTAHAFFRERLSTQLGVDLPASVPATMVAGSAGATLVTSSTTADRQIRRIPRWIGTTGIAAAATLLIALGAMWLVQPGSNGAPDAGNGGTMANQQPGTETNGGSRDVVNGGGADVEYPDEEVLAALELLASDVDLEALAALEPGDLEILGDTEYLAMLESYDLTNDGARNGSNGNDDRGN